MKKIAFKRKDKRCFGNRSGFTLVEAITTLVILAIVAAVAIPSLVGYIDSSREKIAVDECSTVVEAANALGVEHVLEAGVVNYDAVVPLADTSEAGESVYSSVTKEAILKRAELEDKGEIKNFSFDPKDSDGYSQPAYLVNEEEVVVSAAADITLAKNIVSPLAVSVEKTTDTDFNETTGISLTYLEYTASNGIDVVYHNGGYQASSKVNVDFKNHNLSATVKQVLTCEQDEIVLFECSGCDICVGTNNYSVTAVTAFAPGHNYGSAECIDEDTHTHSCTNVLNQLAEGDKALNVGDKLDLEPQYDIYNLPRVAVPCAEQGDQQHFDDITEEVELDEDLEREIPFSLDGDYKSSKTVPAGTYKVTTCSGCGYSEYETQEPEQPKEPEDQDTTWEVDADGYGNWNKVPSSEVNTGGTIVNVSSNDGWGSSIEGNFYNGKQISVPYGPQIRVKNDSDNKYIKKLAVTFIYTYSGVWNNDFNNPCIRGEIDVPITTFENNYADMFKFSQEKIGKNTYAVHIETTDYYTQIAKDYAHKDDSIYPRHKDPQGKLIPGREFVFQFHFAQKLWIDANYKVEVNELEYVETYATKFELNYQGDFSCFDYIKLIGMDLCNEAGEPISTNEDFPKNNPISFYARVGNEGTPKVQFYTSGEQNPLFDYQIPRDEVVKNADNEGIVKKNIPAFDFGLRIKHSDFDAYNYAKKIRISGAGISKTVDVDDGFNLDTYVTGLIPNKNSSDNITVSILSENDLVIANGEIAQETWKNYSAGNNYEVNVNPTAVVLKLKASITDSSISAKTAEINIKGADVLLDSKYVDISGGSAEILAVPTADRDITVSFKSGGKTIAKKSIEIPYLGEMYNIEITNDDVYTEPDIPEPKPNAVNIRIKFDSKFKDDVNQIAFCSYYNPDYNIYGKIYSIDNLIVIDDGFVITNYEPLEWYFNNNDFAVVLKHNTEKIELLKIPKETIMNNLGDTVEIEIKSTGIKIDLTYKGNNYSDIHLVKFGNSEIWNSNSTFNSGDLGAFYITPKENQDLSVTVYGWNYTVISKTFTISWEKIKDSIGKQIDVVLDPV